MWDYVTKDMGREAIVCINKADLVHPHVTHLWLQYFKKQAIQYSFRRALIAP